MSVLEALTGVIRMQLATTPKGVTPALVTLDILAMDFLAQVSAYTFNWEESLLNPIMTLFEVIMFYHRMSLGKMCCGGGF